MDVYGETRDTREVQKDSAAQVKYLLLQAYLQNVVETRHSFSQRCNDSPVRSCCHPQARIRPVSLMDPYVPTYSYSYRGLQKH